MAVQWPQIVEEMGGVMQITPQERVQNRAVEHTVAVLRPQIIQTLGDVMQTTEIIDCVDVPMPLGVKQTLDIPVSQTVTEGEETWGAHHRGAR